jgi:hypothetical protein
LPNGTRGSAEPPLLHAVARCNASIDEDWHTIANDIVVRSIEKKCVFTPRTNVTGGRTMRRNLTLRAYNYLIKNGRATIISHARMSPNTFVSLIEFNDTVNPVKNYQNDINVPFTQIILHPRTNKLEVVINLLVIPRQESMPWFESIDLNIGVSLET